MSVSKTALFRVLIVMIFMVLGSLDTKAQMNMVVENIMAKTNLPNGSINAIEQDACGFVWVGTWKGLYRYDGYSVLNFSMINPEFGALKISTLHVSGNYLWVGSFVSGLYRINLSNYHFDHYHAQASEGYKIGGNDILSIITAPDGRVAVGTERGGLIVIDSAGLVETVYDMQRTPQIMNQQQVSQVIVFNKREIVFNNSNLTILNLESKEWRRISDPAFFTYITHLQRVSESEIFVGSNNGFFKVEITKDKHEITQILNLRTNTILRLKGVYSNVFLLGTVNGLYEYNADNGKVTKFTLNQNLQTTNQNILVLKYTHDDAILIGSDKGLFSLIPRKQHFNHIRVADGNALQPAVSVIKNVGKQLYAGSWGKGLYTVDKDKGILEPINLLRSGNQHPQFVYDLAEHADKLWFSCKNYHGIFYFDYTSKPFRLQYQSHFVNQQGNDQQYNVTTIMRSAVGDLYLGTWEGLLFVYDDVLQRFKIVTNPNGILPSSYNLPIHSIIEDRNKNIWVGTNGGGAFKFKIQNKQIVDEVVYGRAQGLVSDFVTQIFQTRNNRIWIGTEQGLCFIDNDSIGSIFHKDIVFDIQSIMEDPIGFLWLGTQRGVVRLNSNNVDEPHKLFDQADGLKNQSFYLRSIAHDDDFTLYFGGFEGVDYFMPYKLEYNYKKPQPKITEFFLFNQRQFAAMGETEQLLTKNIQETQNIRLKHYQNTFAFSFSNLEYQIPEKCQFAYMLTGIDKDWVYRDAGNRVAYYTKLSPGTYNFVVKSTNNDGVWGDNTAEIEVVIRPPFWASTWAYIIYFSLAMVLISISAVAFLSRVEASHKHDMKDLEHAKQKELSELKFNFFTNISHEFRTPLTLILGPVAKILENEKSDPYHEQHMMVFRNANRLLHLTNRIMDFRKSEDEQLSLKVEQGNIVEFLHNIFLFFKYEADKRDIKYRFKSEWEGEVYFDKEFIESIAFNMLSNAFKYTPNGRSITLLLTQKGDWLNLVFSDTGTGIEAGEQEQIFERFYSSGKNNSTGIGLSFTRRLVELHKGKISVTSEPSVGSVFTIGISTADVYSDAEKAEAANRENVINWASIDLDSKSKAAEQAQKLKSLFAKDDLIALVVDDNLDVRQFLISLLEDQFKVFEADNGATGYELAFKHLPDIIISDVMMPGMTGLELCEKLKSDVRTDHIPVVLATVLSAQSDRIEGLRKGADSYIPKPIDPNHLLVRVNKLIERQLKLKEKFNLADFEVPERDADHQGEVHGINPLIEKAREIVLKNIDNSDYSIDNFCEDLGLSRMQLYRKFKAITGLSANSFIRKVRLHRAAELIKTGKYSVKEVTYDVGFTDLKYFRKCFFDEFGVNPSEYGNA